jgi:hypothetical protein
MADIYRQQMDDLEQFLEADADGHDHLREVDDDMDMDPIMADFGDPNEPDPDFDDYVYGDDPDEFMDLPAGEIQRRLRDLDEGEGKKRHQSPRDRLAAYLDRVGADVDSVMAAVDDAVSRGNEEGSEVSSEDITFNLSDEVLDAIPEDDSDRWHSMLDAVLADEVDLDAFADAEADRQDVEDTQRDLAHPSRFLEASRGRSAKKGGAANCLYILYGGMGVYYYIARGGLSEDEAAEKGQDVTGELAGDQGSADPLSLYDWLQNHDEVVYVFDDESIGGFAEKEEFMEQLRGVGEEEGLFAPEDEINEGDPGDDSDYADHLQQKHGRFTSPENVPGTMQYRDRERAAYYEKSGAPRNTSAYAEYDHLREDDEPLSEARWAKIAGVLKD